MGRFSVDTVFGATDNVSGPMGRMESRAKRFETSLKGINGAADAGMGLATKVAATAAVAGTSIGAVLTNVVSTGMQFEKTLLDAANKFEPGMDKASESFKKLSASAQEVGGNTEFSSSQAASALNDLAGAGFNVDQAISALPKVVNLATAASLDLASAGEIAAKSLGAFGMKSSDPKILAENLGIVQDALMKADAISSTNIPALFEAIKEGGPIAATAGVKLESFMSMAALLGEKGIEGSVAGTTLKNTMITLAAPTKEAAAAFAKLKVTTKSANGELKDPIETLGDLAKATSKMKGAEKVGILEQIFGKIPLAGVSAMLKDVEALRENREAIKGSAGQIDIVAKSKRSGGTGAWDNFTSGIEAVSLKIFDLIGGPINEVINRTTDWIGENRKFIAELAGGLVNKAIPAVALFGIGMKAAFTEAQPIIDGVRGSLGSLFGGGSTGPRQQAFEFGKTIATVGIRFLEFWAITKAVTAATTVYNFVVGAVKAAMLLYESAVTAVKWALVAYDMWSKAGTASTIAMNASTLIASGNMLRMRAAAFAASGGVLQLAKAGAAAAAAYAAWALAADQNAALKTETGGKGIGDVAWEWATTDKGLKEIADENLDREAKERAIAEGRLKGNGVENTSQTDLSKLSALAGSMGSIGELSRQLEAMDKASGQMPPTPGGMPGEAIPGAPGAAPVVPGAPNAKEPPVVSLKEESTQQLSQGMGQALATALKSSKGAVTITIKDPGKMVSKAESDGSDLMSMDPSGSF